MAKQKPSSRFVVQIDGALRRILSIREGSTGDLIVTIHANDMMNQGKRIKDSRYSVHASDRGDTSTIHSVTVHDDGSREDRYLSTTALRDGRFQPICTRSSFDPRALPELVLPARGAVVTLPPYHPGICTMYFALWVCSPEIGDTHTPFGPYSLVYWKSRRFTLFIPFCFTASPSGRQIKFVDYVTTTEGKRSAEHLAFGNRVGPAEGQTPPSTPGTIINEFNKVIAMPFGLLGLEPDEERSLGPKTPNFSGMPIG